MADWKVFARRVRKAAGADPNASGATRIAGTANFKHKYAPYFPIVYMVAAQLGRIVMPAELSLFGLVAPEPTPFCSQAVSHPGAPAWPSYQYCVERAPRAHNRDAPDISRADFTWAMTAIDWGWSIEDVAARLMKESTKAKQNGSRYAYATARNAATAVRRRNVPG